MDSFEVNKILGAVLGTLTFTLALSIGATLLFETEPPAKAGFEIAVPKTAGGGAPATPQVLPIANRLATARPKRGEDLSAQCASCHNFKEGQGPKVGPDLYGVVGRPIASQKGFSYSAAIKKMAAAKKTWTFANLDRWLTDPQTDAPGTAMTFTGIENPQQRADLISYLNQNAAKPLPLPKPEPIKATAPAGKSAAAAAKPNFSAMVATADPKHGEDVAQACASCHNFQKGQGKKIGPDLYGVVGRPIASEKGFSYSAAIQKLAKAKGKWTIDELNAWLTDPQHVAQGTAMTFSGLPSEKQRAEVVAYLNKNSDHPLDLKAAAKPPAGKPAAAKAGGSTPAAPKSPAPAGANQSTGGAEHATTPPKPDGGAATAPAAK